MRWNRVVSKQYDVNNSIINNQYINLLKKLLANKR